ncbi:hypothetical protein EYC84_009778 [Monilinia fructicola]|uniref:Uncharacterized protein n=1 Tax=Monilinia fructicola TaxID=38448 RepID=A0A5M9JC78_MONFR|nr:hypothetical protein EYC84_009778 [Monilinia fructicola]
MPWAEKQGKMKRYPFDILSACKLSAVHNLLKLFPAPLLQVTNDHYGGILKRIARLSVFIPISTSSRAILGED